MKFPKRSIFAATLASILTAGAMFVTVSASAAQEFAPGADLAVELAPIPDQELPPVPAPVAQAAIDPSSVLHDRQHQVSLDANSGFSGRLITLGTGSTAAAGGMNVSIVRNGSVVTTTTTNDDGTFNVSGVEPGVVTVIGTSASSLLLLSVRLVDDGNVFADATPVKLEAESVEIGMYTAAVAAGDVATVKQLIMGGLPTGDNRFNGEIAAADNAFPHGAEAGEKSTSISHHAVELQADGSLIGQLNLLDPRSGSHRDVVDLTLHFVRNGQHVGATEIQRDGRFLMAGLTAGQYSIVTTGQDGILAMGIEVVGSLAQVEKGDEFKLTSIVRSLSFSGSPSQPGDFNGRTASQFIPEQQIADGGSGGEMAPEGVPFGGPTGGPMGGPGGGLTGGGGGGIGGGGGLGALLGAAAAGAIGFAIGDDRSASPGR